MATHAETMIEQLEALMVQHAGKKMVQHDGTMVSFEDLQKKWLQWKSIAAEEAGTRPRVSEINLT